VIASFKMLGYPAGKEEGLMGAVKEILEKWGTVRSRRLALGSFRGGHR